MNETESGHWLEVSLDVPGRGVGAVVAVESTSGDLIGRQEIGVATGYASAHEPFAHFGLGGHEAVRVSFETPDGDVVDLGVVDVDAHLRWPSGCG